MPPRALALCAGLRAAAGIDLLDAGSSIRDPAPARRLPGDGSSRWFQELYEYRYVEALLVIFFVVVTLVFELSWHKIRHASEDSYHFGKCQHEAAMPKHGGSRKTLTPISQHESAKLQHVRHGKHLQLYKELVNRMGGEFMTLGFLALGIFTFNQSGGFKVMAMYFPPCEYPSDAQCFHFPNGAYDWLHMMEVVHVKLFLGMLLYFVFMTFLVNYSVKQIESWEKVKMRMDNVLGMVQNGNAAQVEAELRYVDADLDEHILWRDNFVEHILGWQSRRPDLFAQVAGRLSVDPQAEDASGLMRERIEGHFSLSSYLSLNLEVGVGDSIQVHLPTWLAVVVTFSLFAVLHRFAYLQLRMVTPIILLLFALQVFWVWRFARDKRKKMKRFVDKRQRYEADDSEEAEKSRPPTPARRRRCFWKNPAKSIENNVLRSVQVFMFLESYSLSCAIGDVDMWQDTPFENLLLVLAYALVFLIMAKVTPAVLPDFLAIVSFPPYISDKTLAVYFRVLFDKFELEAEGEEPGDFGQEVAVDEVLEENARRETKRRSMCCMDGGHGPGVNAAAMAAVEELAAILGAREELEQRLRKRGSKSQAGAGAEPEAPEAPEAAEQPGPRASGLEAPGEAFRTTV